MPRAAPKTRTARTVIRQVTGASPADAVRVLKAHAYASHRTADDVAAAILS